MDTRGRSAVLSGILCWTLLTIGAPALGVETAESIAARETIIMHATVKWGRLLNDTRRVAWESPGELYLTSTALYLVYGRNSFVISHALADSQVTDVTQWNAWPLGKPKNIPDQLLVQMMRTNCFAGCVFDLNSREAAERAQAIIADGRQRLDPFGRMDEPRTAWLSAGFRYPAVYWTEQPDLLKAEKKQLPEALRRHVATVGKTTVSEYGDALRSALDETVPELSVHPLDGIEVNEKTELSARSLERALRQADASIHRLLVSDITAISLRERPPTDSTAGIEATFHLFVDYYDLAPPKDGRYFLDTYTVSAPASYWMQLDAVAFIGLLEALSVQVANRIQQDLSSTAPQTVPGKGNLP